MYRIVLLWIGLVVVCAAQQAPPTEVVEVVGQTPLGGSIGSDQVAANVQIAGADEIAAQGLLDLSEYMRRNLGSVFVNEAQSNPLQPDVQYRGYVGSPLLGLPQGLAVYQDGVRLNEPFGDTVNWALLPDSAVAAMSLSPGSNPLFGLNALGGAVTIVTRDGFSSKGTSFSAHTGSFGRSSLQASTGGSSEDFAYFVTGEYLEEDGWRDYSPTEATQLFGKLSWRREKTDFDLSIGLADTDLIGNGALPVQLLATDRAAVYTRPDQTRNQLGLGNLRINYALGDALDLTANVYVRSSDIDTLNGDDSEYGPCELSPAYLCALEDEIEEILLDLNEVPVPANSALIGAVVNRTQTEQDGSGFGLQTGWQSSSGGRSHQLLAGIVFDRSSIGFAADAELGSLDATRRAVPGGVFVGDGLTRLGVTTANRGLYISDIFAITPNLSLTASGRYNDTSIELRDRIGTALNGDHGFQRFNPALGITAVLANGMSVYARYSESTRTPSPVELTCADPDDPCRLPNAFLADPPLEQVVAHSIESGIRGASEALGWHVGVFRTSNHDDILFISAGALTNEGYFDNVGQTRRDGIEVNLKGSMASMTWFANYTFINATFRDAVRLPSPHNPDAVDGEIAVEPGDRLPLLPQHLLSAGMDLSLGERLGIGLGLRAGDSFHLRGDEGNDGRRFGRHALVDLRVRYRLTATASLFLNLDNVFDREYETFGLFGEADEVLGDEFDDPRFLSPGAPRAAWLGIRIATP